MFSRKDVELKQDHEKHTLVIDSACLAISDRQDTVGPLARTVTDAAYMLSIFAGKEQYDNYAQAQPFDTPPYYTSAPNFSGLRGARSGNPLKIHRHGAYIGTARLSGKGYPWTESDQQRRRYILME
jgi:hypothetical protein